MNINSGSNWLRWDLHIHTASSFDYEYKGSDSDSLIVQSWKENNLRAVAITDHFLIDYERINNLRLLAGNEITVFPGVELRTDKGGSNIHVILIFSEQINIKNLSQDFESEMLRSKAKPDKENSTNEEIYWDYNDIVNFANEHDAIISIHSGSKSNGIDDKISNQLEHNMAVKKEYSQTVDIFEVSSLKDIEGYNRYVFSEIPARPVIICSDNHNPQKYKTREYLWIKSKPTFSGLKQAIIHSDQRIYVGDLPPKLHSVKLSLEKYISTIRIKKNTDAKNKDNWFDVEQPINVGLTTIIGNKGSGKSALADLIGYIGKTDNSDNFSFLSNKRFAKEDKNYQNDYSGYLEWEDEARTKVENFNIDKDGLGIPLVRYLPQRYIEETCNNLGDQFQEEINKVIFSYIDDADKENASSLEQLIDQKNISIKDSIHEVKNKISDINEKIIFLEKKTSENYKKKIEEAKNHFTHELNRHDTNKPKVVPKPQDSDQGNVVGLKFIEDTNVEISNIGDEITRIKNNLQSEREAISTIIGFNEKYNKIIENFEELILEAKYLNDKYELEPSINIEVVSELSALSNKYRESKILIEDYNKKLSNNFTSKVYEINTSQKLMDQDFKDATSLYEKQDILTSRIKRANEMLGRPQRNYQKYLDDLSKWEKKRKEIIGSKNQAESLEYYKGEYDYLTNKLLPEINDLKTMRRKYIKELYSLIIKKKKVLDDIYEPIEKKLENILQDIKDKVVFKAMISIDSSFVEETLMYINQTVVSNFRGKVEGVEYINSLIRKYDFRDFDGVINFIDTMLDSATKDEDKVESLIKKRLEFYNHITGLEYFNVGFSLTMGDKQLDQLSPGEKGAVLLIFYLALDKEEKPLIIDQPEDNLDNQSVYDKLVPCVLEAKKNRQVIIITHNPNLAVACDSELIIYSENVGNEIVYSSGSIEEEEIKSRLVDILEGTMPAFDLRRNKYKDLMLYDHNN